MHLIDNVYLGGENERIPNHPKSAKLSPMCAKITKIGITKDRISSRGGLTPAIQGDGIKNIRKRLNNASILD